MSESWQNEYNLIVVSFSVHLASSSVTPAGSVNKSMGDNLVCMLVQLKRCVSCVCVTVCCSDCLGGICECSCMGSVSVSSCRCCMFVACVHPVAVLNAAFCITSNLLMLAEDARGSQMETHALELVS